MKLLPLITFTAVLPLSAQTLILDNFDSADSTDINAGNVRQSGSLAPLDWNKINGGDTAIISNQLSIGGTSSSTDYTVEFDYDFADNAALVAGGQFEISFDLIQLASGSYTAFAMNSDPNQARPAVDTTTEFGLLFRGSDNDISIREGTGSAGAVSIPAASQLGAVVLTVTTDAISNGENFTIGMTIAGNTIDLNGVSAGNDFSGTWDSSDLFFSWGSRTGTSIIDNVAVTAVPEPGAIALALGGISLAWTIRRRKAKA